MATHILVFHVKYVMHDMDGTLEQSAEIAHEQITCALQREGCEYGLPDIHPKDVVSAYSTVAEYEGGNA